ncbi:carboxypeptidase M32 [candidate division TA06 bacterium]|uniref:Metal-dependent carboxypeptidase n=1 Tax=candidate division TA06 bacterium TaxID=2250710 RepID=A0A523UZ33_UNCT6|nr:MAG: carboxypeptidase M32 [candidate division TA06 bacterium]
MEAKLKELKIRLLEIDDLNSAGALLFWDQATYMPAGGASARARQIATLGRLAHEKFTDPAIGKLLQNLRPFEEDQSYDSDDASLIRVTRRKYEKAVKVPPSFTEEFNKHASALYQVWTKARPANDFPRVQSSLEKTLDLSRQLADFFPGYEHIADPLIDFADYGMKVSTVRTLFEELREELVPIVKAITEQPIADDSCLHKNYLEADQVAFAVDVIKRFGYDFERGRQDKTHHPFMTKFSLGDVRITTRAKENDLSELMFSTMHEAGHALYEQGISMGFEGTPLADGTSSGVHESQSRLWENLVGRSKGFWQFFYPRLQKVFPDQLKSVPLDTFYRAINRVERSLIRTDADEVTYNLHVMIRFKLELDMLEGRLAVTGLAEAWRERYKADLGTEPPDDRDGVLQDIHWFVGTIGGMFQGYTLGNILTAQFFEAALKAHREISAEIEKGEFGTLHNWLKENIYQHGSKYTASELVERVTGGPVSIQPYIRYLKKKYGELYDL